MSLCTNPEHSIKQALVKFIEEINGNKSVTDILTNSDTIPETKAKCMNTLIDDFMVQLHKRRTLSLDKDTFLSVCLYLHDYEILILVMLCKEYYKYYKYIWVILQKYYFPNSILPTNNYLVIRNNLAISKWWYELKYLKIHDGPNYMHWYDITNIDENIQKRMADLKFLAPTGHTYKYAKITHSLEIKSEKKTRDEIFNICPQTIQNLITDYKFISNAFYIIKPELDMRIYGLDPNDAIDVQKWDYGILWIQDELTDMEEYNFGSEDDNNEIYKYDFDSMGLRFRYRIKPSWL